MFNWFLNLFPDNYKWEVAIKKISYTIAKVAVTGLVATKVGSNIAPNDALATEAALGAAVAASLEWVHDWARLKFPQQKWL